LSNLGQIDKIPRLIGPRTLEKMIVKFWGVRGSIPVPGPSTARIGGNTSCIQVSLGRETVILDSGTGIRELGRRLERSSEFRRIHILLSHTHWDHIQGLPFFAPLYRRGQEIVIYGPRGLERGLEEAVLVQLQRLYFPIRKGEIGASLAFRELGEETFDLDGARIATKWMNHPVLSLGFKISAPGKSMIYTGDNEPYSFFHVYAPTSEATVKIAISDRERGKRREALLEFIRGADLLVADAQYSDEEYEAKAGWGHSPLSYVVDMALEAQVGRLALFHHDPSHSDDDLQAMSESARSMVESRGGRCELILAAEGSEIEL
jgi:phosphoribosyl 1,2-cyclic phosphodiesterase